VNRLINYLEGLRIITIEVDDALRTPLVALDVNRLITSASVQEVEVLQVPGFILVACDEAGSSGLLKALRHCSFPCAVGSIRSFRGVIITVIGSGILSDLASGSWHLPKHGVHITGSSIAITMAINQRRGLRTLRSLHTSLIRHQPEQGTCNS
jgi:hypothetical protein